MTERTDFKKGDRVRVLGGTTASSVKDAIGTVVRICKEGTPYPVDVAFEPDGAWFPFDPDELEHVK